MIIILNYQPPMWLLLFTYFFSPRTMFPPDCPSLHNNGVDGGDHKFDYVFDHEFGADGKSDHEIDYSFDYEFGGDHKITGTHRGHYYVGCGNYSAAIWRWGHQLLGRNLWQECDRCHSG